MKIQLKNKLIRFLGGVPKQEHRKCLIEALDQGAYNALTSLKYKAEYINGLDADRWCKVMYTAICEQLKALGYDTD